MLLLINCKEVYFVSTQRCQSDKMKMAIIATAADSVISTTNFLATQYLLYVILMIS